MAATVEDLLARYDAWKCVACGKCTYTCPAAQIGGDFSPRKIIEEMVISGGVPKNRDIWTCTTCAQCTEICQFGVNFHEVARSIRPELRSSLTPEENHQGVLEMMARLSAIPEIKPRTANWVTEDLLLDDSSKVLLYVGCTPYYDVVFRYLRQDLLDIPRSAVRLLNALGVRPKLLQGERCCGHDAYWLGESELFDRLAKMNLEMIENAKVDTVITFCPECASTIKQKYPEVVGKLDFEVYTLTEVLGDAIRRGELEFTQDEEIRTYHDPCRLGRHSGIYDEPRELLSSLGGLEEMPRSRQMGACCGNSSWVNCGPITRLWQLDRLKEASETGASTVVTACPKCLIHFTCAQVENVQLIPRPNIPVVDIHVLAASQLTRL